MGAAALVSAPPARDDRSTHPAAVRAAGFGKRFGAVWALRNVSFEVRAGELFGVIGPDGAGKSSLLKSMAGVLAFEAGTLTVLGIQVCSERSAERVKARLGFMPQGLGHNLYPELSVDENVDFFARLRLVPAAARAECARRLLAMARLDRFRNRPVKQLSGGMKQKLALVCTLVHEPELLILDEPTTGVDPVSRRAFWAMLAELTRERGMTAIVSTSYMDEVDRFDRVALLDRRSLLAHGTPAEIRRLVPGTVVAVRVEPQQEAHRRLTSAFPRTETLGAWLRILVPRTSPAAARRDVVSRLDGLAVGDVTTSEPEPDDVLVALTEASPARAAVPREPAAGERVRQPPAVLIEARSLVRDFGRFRAVDGVSFRVRAGEVLGLLGANGAGKTTVIKMLTGLIAPTAGAACVTGADMRRAGRVVRQRIGYMSQAFSLYQDLTVAENIALYAGIYGLDARRTAERAAWVTEMAGLAGREHTLAGRLPAGLRQRLALGCALVHRPVVLFLDEPTAGVDPAGRRRFWEILFSLARDDRIAAVLTTHYLKEAEHCDHVVLLHAGRVAADGSPADLEADAERQHGVLLQVETDAPQAALLALRRAGFEDAALLGARVQVAARDAARDEPRLRRALERAGVGVRAIRRVPTTLDDVFVRSVLALEREEAGAPGDARMGAGR